MLICYLFRFSSARREEGGRCNPKDRTGPMAMLRRLSSQLGESRLKCNPSYGCRAILTSYFLCTEKIMYMIWRLTFSLKTHFSFWQYACEWYDLFQTFKAETSSPVQNVTTCVLRSRGNARLKFTRNCSRVVISELHIYPGSHNFNRTCKIPGDRAKLNSRPVTFVRWQSVFLTKIMLEFVSICIK